MQICITEGHGRYFMAQSPVSFVITMAWLSNSISESSSKRAVAIAFVNSFSCLGDIGGSYVLTALANTHVLTGVSDTYGSPHGAHRTPSHT